MNKEISGVFAAVPTPFDADGLVDARMFHEHCEWVVAQGANGLNVLGSTGEASSQTRSSRLEVMRTAAEGSYGDAALMVGTGTPSLGETIELTRQAASMGFDAALVLPPYYYAPLSDDGLFEYFSRVIESVSNTDIGIYLYNFPQMTGLVFSAELVERLVQAFPNHMRGMKDSSGDLEYSNSLAAQFADRFAMFPGSEGPLPDATRFGYAGCISASVNATVRKTAEIWRQRGEASDAAVTELRELRDDIASVPMVAAVKALVTLRTGDIGWRRMLPPLVELTGANQQKIEAVAARLQLS